LLRRRAEESQLKPTKGESRNNESNQGDEQENQCASEDPVDHGLAHGPDIINGTVVNWIRTDR